MEPRESIQIRVGLFVFAGVFLAMILIFLLGSEKQLFKRQYALTAFFQDISGLRVGAQVQLAGLNAGMVDRIALAPELGDRKVQIRLSIDKAFQERIRRDSIATINTQGLLGDKIVSVSLGGADEEILKDGETIKSEERPSLFSIAEKGGAIMENINKAAKAVTGVLDEVEKGKGLVHTLIYESEDRPVGRDFAELAANLRDASKDLRQVLRKVNKGEGTIGAFLTDPSLYYDLRRLFSKVERNKILMHVIRSRVRDLELEKVEGETK